MGAIEKILSHGGLVIGASPEIEEFEKNLASFLGVKHAVATGSGTQSLCLAYRAVGIGPGDEVITTSHTFVATIDQIKYLGAVPVLVDIGEDGLIDPDLIEKAITPRTKAIVPVHLEGKVCDMDRIMDIAKRYNLVVVEDAAQAVGAKYKARTAGTIGNAGCFSFFPAKVLGSFGNGGAVITNDDQIAADVRMRRCNGNIGKNPDINAPLGWNLEPDGLQCAVLNVTLKYLPERLARRAEIASRYDEAFKDLSMKLPLKQEGRIYQDYVVRLESREKRDAFAAYLAERGVGVLGHNLTPNHLYKSLGAHFNLPKTEEYTFTQCRIACNPDLTDEEVEKVIENVRSFFA